MRTTALKRGLHAAAALLVVAALATGCRPKPPEAPPAPVPPPPEISATGSLIDADTAIPGLPEVTPDVVTVTVGARRADAAGSAAVARPAKPPPVLDAMKLAAAGSKLGVPVDLRYQFDGEVQADRPVTLHLAAVPRVAGSNLSVSVQDSPGIDALAAPITAQKAAASQAYRQQLSVTRHANAPSELRVLVTMDVAEGPAFGYFSVPLDGTDAAR